MKEKVLVIGLDGATFNLVRPWAREGKLPNFARLMEEGVSGDLLSTPDMLSPAAWTSFSTGKNSGKHGIFNFFDLVPGTLKTCYMNSRHREGETIWSLLTKAGKKVGVMNVPMTYPADAVDGFMISGWNAPTVKSEGFTYPGELIDEIVGKFGDYPLFPTVKKHIVNGDLESAARDLYDNVEINASAARYLMDKNDWDFFIVVFIATDQVQHYFWHLMDPGHPQYDAGLAARYGDTILNVYRKCDRIIGDLTKGLSDDTTVIVMSDHGCGKNQGAVQYLPLLLKEMGFSAFKESAGVLSGPKVLLGSALKKAYQLLNRRLSIKLKGHLNAMLPWLRDRIESTWRFSAYDWDKTSVYFHYEPRVNLSGREPFGIVKKGQEYEDLRDLLIRSLYACRDAKTGQKIVERVFKGEEVYNGKFASNGPDIIIWWKEDVVISGVACDMENGRSIRLTRKYVVDERTGNHTPNGIFLARGRNIRKGSGVSGAGIMDIAPTILHLMGQPVPSDMDGKVLTDALTDEFLRANPVRRAEAADARSRDGGDAGDDQKIMENLKSLGYM